MSYARRNIDMIQEEWILCPICGNKTRVRIRKDTELKNFPLYCPKCSRESLIEVKNNRNQRARRIRRRADESVIIFY